MIDLKNIKHAFIIGIGGTGISAIARMLLQNCTQVSGSDISESSIVKELREKGAHISMGQSLELIPEDVDLVIYTVALKKYDAELYDKVITGDTPARSYPEMLHIVTDHKYTIAVAGTHGKTTTTAMGAKVFTDTGNDPSVIVGSKLKDFNSNLLIGSSKYFLVEACEYERSFLNINPEVLVITNIEADHLDYYKDLADIQSAFKELVAQTKTAVVCDPNHPAVTPVLVDTGLTIIDYTKYIDSVPELQAPGQYNRENAATMLAVADFLSFNTEKAKQALSDFSGTARRFDYKGVTKDGGEIYDDYAHHPTEVVATLSGVRARYPNKKIVVLFQPHLPSRTKALFSEFTEAFSDADQVFLLPIFLAREEADTSVSSERLAEAIDGSVLSSVDEAVRFFEKETLDENTLFITMGAGEAYKVGEALLYE